MVILGGANDQDIEELLLHNINGIADENNGDNKVELSLKYITDAEVKTNFRFESEDTF